MSRDYDYEDVDEDGNELQSRGQQPKWRKRDGHGQRNLLDRAFEICGDRKYFGAPFEARDWKKISKAVDKGVMSREWVENCMAWAAGMNKDVFKITFSKLLSAILNITRQKEWEARQELNKTRDEKDLVVIDKDDDYVEIG